MADIHHLLTDIYMLKLMKNVRFMSLRNLPLVVVIIVLTNIYESLLFSGYTGKLHFLPIYIWHDDITFFGQ